MFFDLKAITIRKAERKINIYFTKLEKNMSLQCL